jgi:YVTN family beta-propeller protein
VAYDSGNGDIYTASFLSNTVSVISTATNAVIASVPVGNASDITYDSGNGNLYVSNYWSGNLSVISGATNKAVGSIHVGGYPYGVRYDGGSGDLYVENWVNTLLVVSDKSNTIVANVSVGLAPSAAAYDSINGCVYVDNDGSNNVSVINGSTYKVVANIPVGNGPMDIRFDPGNGDIYTPNWFSNNTTVISGLTNKVIANIPVGTEPNGAGYDPGNGDVYVDNWVTSNVSVISGATNKVVANIAIGAYPWYMAYAPSNGGMYIADNGGDSVSEISTLLGLGNTSPYYRAIGVDGNVSSTVLNVGVNPASVGYDHDNGDFYVSNAGSGNVSVISGSTDRVVDTIPAGTYPFGVVYDSSNGDVYVTNAASNNVSIISGLTDKVVASAQVGSAPLGVAYDSGNGNLFVSNYGGNTVSVVSGSKVVGAITVGTNPAGVAYDSMNGYIYVANSATNNLSVISGSTDTVIATIGVGNDPSGVAIDSWNGDVYVTNFNSNNVTVVSGTSNQVITSMAVGTQPFNLAFDSANGNVYVTNAGQDTVSVISGTTNKVVNTLNVGKRPQGIAYDADQGSLYVADTGSNSTNTILTLLRANATTIASADIGQTLSLSTPILGQGAGEARFNVSESPSSGLSCHTDTPQYRSILTSCAATGSGLYNVTLTVHDSAGYSVQSSLEVVIGALPGVLAPSASPPSIDVGQNVTFTSAVPTGGVGPYNYSWSGLPTGCSRSTTSAVNCTPPDLGQFNVTVTVKDSNGYSATSSARSFVIHGDPTVLVPTPSEPAGIVGHSVTFSTSGSGGSGGLSYRWTFSSSSLGCNPSYNDTAICTPTHAGNYTVNVTVVDSNGGTGTAISGQFEVSPAAAPLTISSFSAHPSSVTIGGFTYLNVTASGGTGTLSYTYTGLPAGCGSSDTASLKCTPTATGSFTVRVFSNDTASHFATATASLTITAAAIVLTSVSVSPVAPDIAAGGSQQFMASPTCSATCPSGVTYTWTLSPNGLGNLSSAMGSTTTFTAGSKTGTVTLTLSASLGTVTKWTNATITITSKSSPTGFLGFSGDTGYILIGVIIAVVVAAMAIIALRGRIAPPTSPAKVEAKEDEKGPAPAGSEKPDGKPEAEPVK